MEYASVDCMDTRGSNELGYIYIRMYIQDDIQGSQRKSISSSLEKLEQNRERERESMKGTNLVAHGQEAVDDQIADGSFLPVFTSALVDEGHSLTTMTQHLENLGSSGAPSAFAPSIASRSTDLFEGDLCDDELNGKISLTSLAYP